MEELRVEWSEYVIYKMRLRSFKLEAVEQVLRHSSERYTDTATGRRVVVGRHDRQLIVVPYEVDEDRLLPVTVHAVTRKQIANRVKSGRFIHE